MNSSHQLHESRSLQMHRLVAERYRRDPQSVVRFALANIARWRNHDVECDDFRIWEKLLAGPPSALLDALAGTSEESVRLRQSSPFAGLIPEADRRKIIAATE